MVQNVSSAETLSPFSIKDLPDIVRGHEIWVEHEMQNISLGNHVVCDLCFGHNMKSDKAVQVEKMTPAVFTPRGENRTIKVSAEENRLSMHFTPAFEGYHIIGVEYNGGILNLPHPGLEGPKYYEQYTKTIIQVGDYQAKESGLEKGIQGIYYQKVMTATFTIMDVGEN